MPHLKYQSQVIRAVKWRLWIFHSYFEEFVTEILRLAWLECKWKSLRIKVNQNKRAKTTRPAFIYKQGIDISRQAHNCWRRWWWHPEQKAMLQYGQHRAGLSCRNLGRMAKRNLVPGSALPARPTYKYMSSELFERRYLNNLGFQDVPTKHKG